MEAILSSSIPSLLTIPRFSAKSFKTHFQFAISNSCTPSNALLSFSSPKLDFSCRTIPTTYTASTNAHKHRMVLMEPPPQGLTSRPQIIDYYVMTLQRVLGSEREAQMCIYDASCDGHFGFCCDIAEDEAEELAGLPGVLSVKPDPEYDSKEKDYSLPTFLSNVKTKKLFVTGLSFYTSEKTLRAAFEGYGELVEVKIIMDKISKRSKGYAFVEYTTEESANAALNQMNGKIINGWMITVDIARKNQPIYNRGSSGLAH